MLINDHNLDMLNAREDWTNWINSIEDLIVRNDVWNYCDPEGIENLVFTATKLSDSASKDTIQKYHSLQAIYESKKKKYNKVSNRINLTNQNIRTEFESLKKGPGSTSLDKWLSRWPALVSNAKRYKIENLSESQICNAFIKASHKVNLPFYNYIKSKEAQVKNKKNLIKEAAKIMKKILNVFLTALNEINPDHASNGSITVASSADSEEDENDQNDDATIVQKAQNTTNRALRTFRKLT
ncbi:hypothetical protein FOMG_16916 [Fusarium oxysporum f. sp. melonis 26406]|uniref:Uncharacterized protein n=1 Tax=Fusarium oxysporum f. sp. melonis 26406 TaxID=1089452 RepID=W9ZD98_FUSOX|nr:hypothetical protein FOMG_16916 [Fusarium oxysporum f. sp. melonis 26406]